MLPYGFTTTHRLILATVLAMVAAGCNQNPYLAGTALGGPGTNPTWGTPNNASVAAGEARLAELSRRVQLLDDNNRQLHIQLAQSEQQARVHQDEADLLRQQLGDVNSQMRQTAIAARQSAPSIGGDPSGVQGIRASATLPPRGGDLGAGDFANNLSASGGFGNPAAGGQIASGPSVSTTTMRANTNLSQNAARLNLGFPIETEGDVIRIMVPSDQLFTPGTAQFHSQANAILEPIASQLRTLFPGNRIGIEGYTDNSAAYGAGGNPHQLTSAQADAVLNLLGSRGGLAPTQLFTVAQGANNPRANNVTPAGRAANRRIEIVVYP